MPLAFRHALGVLALAAAAAACGRARAAGPLPLETIKLPPGFRIELYAHPVPGARSMALGPRGTLFVGTRDQGSVYAVVDADRDGRADEVLIVARGLRTPNGVAVHDGALYVAELNRILRFGGIEERLKSPPVPVIVKDDLPRDESHGWKFIAFGPDGLLYVPIGAPCNICDRGDPYASINRLKPDGTGFETVARGVRNTVGFDWSPVTRELWFTDNGRDMMGDDTPPDELNRLSGKAPHFGYPWCHGGDVPDPKFGKSRPCSEFTAPARKLGPHVAALGMRFYTGSMFPEEYRGQVFIAEHGSWNRSRKAGYRVMLVRVKGFQAVSYEPFAEGWLRGESEWGRPVDVLVMPDGALLVSDDAAGAIYRISYQAP